MIEIDIGPNLVDAVFVFTWIVSWHGFFSFVAVATAVILVGRWGPLRGIHPDDIYSIAIWAIIGGVVGARAVHVIDNWTLLYQHSPGEILAVWKGGIALWGGILGGFIGGSAYALITRHPVGLIADLTAPALLIGQTIGRLGDIINGEHCAKATDFFLGFTWTHPGAIPRTACENGFTPLGGETSAVEPVILYEMAWNMVALFIIWKLRGRLKPDGMLFALYLALYSVGRFAVSFLREDRIWALGLQEAQYVALLVLAVTIPLMVVKARFAAPALATEGAEAPVAVRQERGTRAERRRRQ